MMSSADFQSEAEPEMLVVSVLEALVAPVMGGRGDFTTPEAPRQTVAVACLLPRWSRDRGERKANAALTR